MPISDVADRAPLAESYPPLRHAEGGYRPLLVLLAPPVGRGASWAAEVQAAGAQAVLLSDPAALPALLETQAVDAIVLCADDSAKCRERVAAARRRMRGLDHVVPLIVWRADPTGPCGARSFLYQAGADGVLDAPSSVSDLLACAYALRRLIRHVHSGAA